MRASIRQTTDVSGLDRIRAIGLAYAVDGANIGEFDSHRCVSRLKVLAYEEKYIERRGKTKKLVCGSHLVYVWQIRRSDRRYLAYIWQTHVMKTSKTYPRSGCFRRRRAIYKRDVSGQKAKSAIHNADRPVGMGVLRKVISREYTLRPTAGERCVAWQLIRVLATARGTFRMVPRWIVLRLAPEPFVPHRRPCRMGAVERWLAQPP